VGSPSRRHTRAILDVWTLTASKGVCSGSGAFILNKCRFESPRSIETGISVQRRSGRETKDQALGTENGDYDPVEEEEELMGGLKLRWMANPRGRAGDLQRLDFLAMQPRKASSVPKCSTGPLPAQQEPLAAGWPPLELENEPSHW
jgi:hypothetical protein